MKIGGSDSMPYIPLPVDNPLLIQREQLQIQQNVGDEQTEQKTRELVAQQAGAHAVAQVQQNQFVDASKSIQNQAFLEGKEVRSPKRGMKRSAVTQQELRDPSQSPLSSGFQNSPRSRDVDRLLQQQGAGLAQTTRTIASEGGQAQSIPLARRPMIRPSVQSVSEHVAEQKAQAGTQSVSGGESTQVPSSGTLSNTATQSANASAPQAEAILQNLQSSPAAEQKTLLTKLAQSGDSQVLQQALQSFAEGGDWASDKQIRALGEAVASSAPDAVKADFVKAGLPSLQEGSGQGAALAQALGGLKHNPALVQDVLQSMNPQQIEQLVSQAGGKHVSVSMNPDAGATVTTSYHAEPLASMLEAVGGVAPGSQKTAVERAARNLLQDIQGAQSSPEHLVVKNKSDQLIVDALQQFFA